VLDNAPACYVKSSPIHGMGLFTDAPFLKGETVLNYGLFPEVWFECFYNDLPEEKKQKSNFVMIDHERCITTDRRTKFGYVNHSRHPNCDYDFKNRLLIANKLIPADEEVTIDYRTEPAPPGGGGFPDWI